MTNRSSTPEVSQDEKLPEPHVRFPTADELREFSARCNALGDAVRTKHGFMGTAAIRAAIDLDYLSRLVDAEPVKHIGQWQVVIRAVAPKKTAKRRKK